MNIFQELAKRAGSIAKEETDARSLSITFIIINHHYRDKECNFILGLDVTGTLHAFDKESKQLIRNACISISY